MIQQHAVYSTAEAASGRANRVSIARPAAASIYAIGAALAVGSPAAANTLATIQTEWTESTDLQEIHLAIVARVAALREIASEDDIAISEDSIAALTDFVTSVGDGVRIPAITLQDNGTMRAIWRNTDGEQAALLFISGGAVQFVAFARCENGEMGRVTGMASARQTKAQLKAAGAFKLLKA